VRVPSDQRPLSTDENKLLEAAITDLIKTFGLGAVKQEIYRRPKPEETLIGKDYARLSIRVKAGMQ
jgi:hypothetical protein